MPEKKILISAKNIGVIYNQNRSVFKYSPFEAIKDISLEIHAGDSIGVIGRNGAGKST